jgi:septum site-determining protein MinD
MMRKGKVKGKDKVKSKIVVVTSGKGGVGKTTTSASISMGLAQRGFKTVVIDFDVGLRNLDIVLGCERRVIYDFVNVIQEQATLRQALIKDKRSSNLYLLAASQTHDKDSLTRDGVSRVLKELKALDFDYIICDSPAGIEAGALHAMYFADEAIIVTNPEVSSIRDSDRVIGLLNSKTDLVERGVGEVKVSLLVTRYDEPRVKRGEMLSIEDVNDILSLDILGIIPESKDVIESSNKGMPAITKEDSLVAETYKDCVSRLIGEDVPFRDLSPKRGILKTLFGG